MPEVWIGVIISGVAVIGTLAGGLLGWWSQASQARAARRAEDRARRRKEQVDAVVELAVALAHHRRMTWAAESARVSGAPSVEAVNAAFETWAAVTTPLTRLKILASQFTSAAEAVTDAIYEMQNAKTSSELETLRDRARKAHDALLRQASSEFAHGETKKP